MTTNFNRSKGLARWLVPFAIIMFCVVAIWMTVYFDRMPPILKRGIQPADFPRLVAGLLILLSVLTIWLEPVSLKEKLSSATWGTLLLMVFFVALTMIDFFLALGVFALGLAFIWGERGLLQLGLVGIIVPLAVFFFFDLVFKVRFPKGLLTSIWYG